MPPEDVRRLIDKDDLAQRIGCDEVITYSIPPDRLGVRAFWGSVMHAASEPIGPDGEYEDALRRIVDVLRAWRDGR